MESFLWPTKKAWASLAVVWVFMLGLHLGFYFGTLDSSTSQATKARISHDTLNTRDSQYLTLMESFFQEINAHDKSSDNESRVRQESLASLRVKVPHDGNDGKNHGSVNYERKLMERPNQPSHTECCRGKGEGELSNGSIYARTMSLK
ncbi:MAG: hypothetical protein K9N52_04380, partial [Verrucomicrobia bacterium]|nr:hypothetical protein [Verrucomicrobiota bacterium]